MREARAYYNEIDRDAVHVLRSLIADGLIADGDVDDRSIVDVRPEDLAGYTQCHFFAGAGIVEDWVALGRPEEAAAAIRAQIAAPGAAMEAP